MIPVAGWLGLTAISRYWGYRREIDVILDPGGEGITEIIPVIPVVGLQGSIWHPGDGITRKTPGSQG